MGARVAREKGSPAISEFIPGYEMTAWYGVCAPRKTPAEIIAKLNKEINAGLAEPAMKERFADLGGEPLIGSPADFGRRTAEDTERWGKVIRADHIRAE